MPIKYEHHNDANGYTIACDSCKSEVPIAYFAWNYGQAPKDSKGDDRPLCEFCAKTMTGTYTDYPPQDDFTALRAEIWKAAACVANFIKHGEKS